MISVIHGAEGSGKTKRVIDAANAACEKATGLVILSPTTTNRSA